MKKLTNLLIYICFFLMVFILLFPKSNGYYFLEKELLKQKVIIANEQLNEGLVSLGVNHGDIYYNKLQVANIKQMDIVLGYVYNQITLNKVSLKEEFKGMFPSKIDNATVNYSVLNPLNVTYEATGLFGRVEGTLNLSNKKLLLKLLPSPLMKNQYSNVLSQMKVEKGGYIYEYQL